MLLRWFAIRLPTLIYGGTQLVEVSRKSFLVVLAQLQRVSDTAKHSLNAVAANEYSTRQAYKRQLRRCAIKVHVSRNECNVRCRMQQQTVHPIRVWHPLTEGGSVFTNFTFDRTIPGHSWLRFSTPYGSLGELSDIGRVTLHRQGQYSVTVTTYKTKIINGGLKIEI